jgi:hypothetical protein
VRVRCSRKRTQTLAQELYRQQRGKIQQSLGHRVDVANSTSINPVSDALPCIAITEKYVPPMYKMQYEGREGSPYCFFKSPGFEGLAPASRCSHFSSFFSELRRRALRSAQKIHVNKPMLQATKDKDSNHALFRPVLLIQNTQKRSVHKLMPVARQAWSSGPSEFITDVRQYATETDRVAECQPRRQW